MQAPGPGDKTGAATECRPYRLLVGDIFPYMFREAGLGPLIGKRSWGGVVGIQGRGPLIDGGTFFVPGSGLASKEGQWIIEGYGVDPSCFVDGICENGGDKPSKKGRPSREEVLAKAVSAAN